MLPLRTLLVGLATLAGLALSDVANDGLPAAAGFKMRREDHHQQGHNPRARAEEQHHNDKPHPPAEISPGTKLLHRIRADEDHPKPPFKEPPHPKHPPGIRAEEDYEKPPFYNKPPPVYSPPHKHPPPGIRTEETAPGSNYQPLSKGKGSPAPASPHSKHKPAPAIPEEYQQSGEADNAGGIPE